MTSDALIGLLQTAVTLVVGGAGFAALHQFLVRAQVHWGARTQPSLTILREADREAIEGVLRQRGVPTAFAEVEWWNNGLREANDIKLEIRTSGPIRDWQLVPASTDLAAPWTCTSDPRATDGDLTLIRVEQPTMRAGARCRLSLGFEAGTPFKDIDVRGYWGRQAMTSFAKAGNPYEVAGALLALALPVLAYLIGKPWLQAHSVGGKVTDNAQLVALLVLGVTIAGPLWLARVLRRRFGPGLPSWGIQQQKKDAASAT